MTDIDIEIDGKPFKAKPNSMVIQVADEAGIYIPRFCYHKHLSVAANCRMCLVEVEKSPKTLPACATPVMPGMKIFTRSPKALAAQKAVMEFLLINHPLDCPICDQGGECELQDLSLGYGSADSFFSEGKRSVKDEDLGSLIQTDMTRCIQCTRCVRFGDEIAGVRELGAVNRGEHMEISTYVGKSMSSEVSGNIIDLCPVGALTSKPFRFTARAWELTQFPSIAPHDCVGSNMNTHIRDGRVMRIVPRENDQINETWISDRDRFSYEGLYHAERASKPLIKKNNQWQESDWLNALEFALAKLQEVKSAHGAEQLAALASPSSTLEEFYLLQKLMRQIGSNNIDHRLRQVDFNDQTAMPFFPGLHQSFADLENADVIILIGSNIQKEQPSASLRIRKASRKGAKVIVVNMVDYPFNFNVTSKKIAAPHQFIQAVADMASSFSYSENQKVSVLIGAQALNHSSASKIRMFAQQLAETCKTQVGYLTEGANSSGAWLAGAVPHRHLAGEFVQHIGLNAKDMLEKDCKGYVLLNVEPELDCANSAVATQAMKNADCIIALSMYASPFLLEHADVILPIGSFAETSGTFVNATGEWQSFKGVASPLGQARPAWKVLRVLGNLFDFEDFEYNSTEEIAVEIAKTVAAKQDLFKPLHLPATVTTEVPTSNKNENTHLARIGEIPIYSGDSLVRRAKALQIAQPVVDGAICVVRLHPDTAKGLNISEGDIVKVSQEGSVELPVILDKHIPVGAAWIPGALDATRGLGELFGWVELSKV